MRNHPKAERNDAIRAAAAGGVSLTTLAILFGVTRQRVEQIVRAPEKKRIAHLLRAKVKEQRNAMFERAFAASAGR